MKPWRIPRRWIGETAVLIGGGPSLSMEQIHAIPKGVRILGINDAYLVCPWMDLHYACDLKWWDWHHDKCRALLSCDSVTQDRAAAEKYPDLKWVEGRPLPGLSYEPTAIHTGKNSGYQAINLAVLMGAKKIVLLGYDMKVAGDGSSHWFGDHPDRVRSWYESWFPQYATLVEPLESNGIEVINCTPDSALECFPKMKLLDALCP